MSVLDGKKIYITGAGSGIGAACVKRFLEEGADVIWSDVNAAASERSPRDIAARFIHHDVTSAEGWQAVEFALKSRFDGPLDGLVNNAGYYIREDIEQVSQASFRQTMNINVEGALLGCQMALRLMVGGGAIVNVASIAGLHPGSWSISYGASKAALLNLTSSVAHHCVAAQRRIRCNAVCPGAVSTPMSADALEGASPGAVARRYEKASVLGRMAEPSEMSDVIAFLLSDRSAYITGASIVADGGMLL